MTIVYLIFCFITFPGVFIHAFWEHLICGANKTSVDDARYFRLNEMCGHVEHDLMDTTSKRFLLCFLPFLFNLLLGLIIALPAAITIFSLPDAKDIFKFQLSYWVCWIMLWLGISLLTNVFPSVEDAMAMWESLYHNKTKKTCMAAKILLAPIAAILYGGAWISKVGLAIVIAVPVAVFFPNFIGLFIR